MDIETLEQQLRGLESRGKELREKEQIFLKSQGLREQEEKSRDAIGDLSSEIQGIKEEIIDLRSKRNGLMEGVLSKIRNAMDTVLPTGRSFLRISGDGKLDIGWNMDGKERPYKGLSGGETVSFNMALSRALGSEIVLVESAELDPERMSDQLSALDKFDGQVVASSCHLPKTIPQGWDVVEL